MFRAKIKIDQKEVFDIEFDGKEIDLEVKSMVQAAQFLPLLSKMDGLRQGLSEDGYEINISQGLFKIGL